MGAFIPPPFYTFHVKPPPQLIMQLLSLVMSVSSMQWLVSTQFPHLGTYKVGIAFQHVLD